MEIRDITSSEVPTTQPSSLYPNLDSLHSPERVPSASNTYDNLYNRSTSNTYDNLPEEERNATQSAANADCTGRLEGGATDHTFRLHKINDILKILEAD